MADAVAIGIDIGGTRTKLGLVTEQGEVSALGGIATPPLGAPDRLVPAIIEAALLLMERGPVAGVGVSVAGFLDAKRTRLTYNPNLEALAGYPLRDALHDALRLDCVLEVDSNAAPLAEHRFGSGRGADRLLGLVLGTGVGAGMVVGGAVLRFSHQCIGDVGHIILDRDGPPCPCGARGCLEALASAGAIAARARARGLPTDLRALAAEKAGAAVFAETADWLGLGLAALAPIFAPDRIVLGGGVAEVGEVLLAPTRAAFERHAAPFFRDGVEIVHARLGASAGVVGAACGVFAADER